jgi:hypothetical protein
MESMEKWKDNTKLLNCREHFDRGHRRSWTEKLQNNLKGYFVNVGCIELEEVRNQWRDFFKD